MNASPRQLNEAFRAMVATVPNRDRLTRFLSEHGLESLSMEIRQTLNGLLATAETILFNTPGGVSWSEEFDAEYRGRLCLSYPWLDDAAFSTLLTWSHWLCWHEGLDVPLHSEAARSC